MRFPMRTLSMVIAVLIAAFPTAADDWVPPSSLDTLPSIAELQSIDRFVDVQRGELPILISAPHGGSLAIPGVVPRTGKTLSAQAGKFVVQQDFATDPLAHALSDAIEKRFGKKPYFVIARAHRRFVDPNRRGVDAYEQELAGEVYRRYHDHLDDWCREMTDRFHGGLLIDLHGQARDQETVFRGTQNGKTVRLLRQRHGESAHVGERSLFGLLRRQGWKIHPDPLSGREQPGYNGGYIVRTYGSGNVYAVDAIQLEFGRSFRVRAARQKTATQLAEALHQYADLYLNLSLEHFQQSAR